MPAMGPVQAAEKLAVIARSNRGIAGIARITGGERATVA
jgi:hypothetical protein